MYILRISDYGCNRFTLNRNNGSVIWFGMEFTQLQYSTQTRHYGKQTTNDHLDYFDYYPWRLFMDPLFLIAFIIGLIAAAITIQVSRILFTISYTVDQVLLAIVFVLNIISFFMLLNYLDLYR